MTQRMATTETLQKGATPQMGAPKQTTQVEGVELDQTTSNCNYIEHEIKLLKEVTTKTKLQEKRQQRRMRSPGEPEGGSIAL